VLVRHLVHACANEICFLHFLPVSARLVSTRYQSVLASSSVQARPPPVEESLRCFCTPWAIGPIADGAVGDLEWRAFCACVSGSAEDMVGYLIVETETQWVGKDIKD
jgi:hypothetical protein